jgi:hypothetical protein
MNLTTDSEPVQPIQPKSFLVEAGCGLEERQFELDPAISHPVTQYMQQPELIGRTGDRGDHLSLDVVAILLGKSRPLFGLGFLEEADEH